MSLKLLTQLDLDQLATQAYESTRKRSHYNFHDQLSDPIQRLAICMQPETYVRPHRHPHSFELLVPITGNFIVLYFDVQGRVTNRFELGVGSTRIIQHPVAEWHAVASLSKDATIFEVKVGPYAAPTEQDLALWSPKEGSQQVTEFVAKYKTAQVGDQLGV